jgi:hypothetical protein
MWWNHLHDSRCVADGPCISAHFGGKNLFNL